MKILGCGYRRWALDIFDYLKRNNIDVEIMSKEVDVTLENIKEINPNVVLFYGWSWKVSDDIINNYLCLCLHPSPLPKYRGGSPIQNQIMNGEIESAVTIFKMTKEMDAGPVYSQTPYSLDGELHEILKSIRDIGTFETLKLIKELNNGIKFKEQEGKPTYFERRKEIESEITAEELKYGTSQYLYNKVRSLQYPYPNAFITCADGKRLMITEARIE